MYFVIVILLLFLCPLASVAVEAFRFQETLTNWILIGRWWAFWAVGVRLFLAGMRQVVQPQFTAEEIFEIHDPSALPVIREIGFANLSIGTLGICSIFRSDWVVPAAIVGGLYYGLAGLVHLPHQNKNAKEYVAMVSDWFAAGMLLWFVLKNLI
jgi:hypothetical protein